MKLIRCRRSVFAISACTIAITSAVLAQNYEDTGPPVRVLSLGYAQVQGQSSRTEIFSSVTRDITYVVGADFGSWSNAGKITKPLADFNTVTAAHEVASFPFIIKDTLEGIELTEGYAYVKIDHPVSDGMRVATQMAALMTPVELRVLLADDPDRYAPVFVGGLANIGVVPRGSDIGVLNDMRITEIEQLTETHVAKLLPFFGLARYPFILSHRTSGGAPGTEVVVYAKSTSATTAEVYYFYLNGTEEHINVGAPQSTTLTMLYAQIPKNQYVRLDMEKINGEWWLPATSITPLDIPCDDPLFGIIELAHHDACIAGLNPTDFVCNRSVSVICP